MKTGKNILVLLPMSEAQKQALEAQAPGCSFSYAKQKTLSSEQLLGAHVIIGNVPATAIAASQKLEWLQLSTAGAGAYLKPGQFPAQALLTNATGAYGLAISEYMIGVLLQLQKKLHLYRDNQHKHLWQSEGTVTSIEGSKTLVIGLGDIGGDFARKMKALGSYTIGVKRHVSAKPDYLDELHLSDGLDELLPQADIIALSLPETSESRALMNRKRLGKLKSSAFLINVGRGSVLDTEALCDLLESGRLAGAALDVTDPEPLPPNHRLWSIRNAVITPHISGGHHLPATLEKIIQIATDNLGRYIREEKLVNIVDFSTGYRKLT